MLIALNVMQCMVYLAAFSCSLGCLVSGLGALLALVVRHKDAIAVHNVVPHFNAKGRLLEARVSTVWPEFATLGAQLCWQGIRGAGSVSICNCKDQT